jgi:hypothetical protein
LTAPVRDREVRIRPRAPSTARSRAATVFVVALVVSLQPSDLGRAVEYDSALPTGSGAHSTLSPVMQGSPKRHRAPAAARSSARTALILTIRAGNSVVLRSGPGGTPVATVSSPDEFGQPAALGVIKRRGQWAAVSTPALADNRLGWVRIGQAQLQATHTRWRVSVDRAARVLTAWSYGKPVARIRVAVGAPASPTPLGRFAVTDKLDGASFSPSYGCCILALSATQPDLPAGWSGGNRVAIHGVAPGMPLGTNSSAGCVHVADAELRWLYAHIPVGTPVTVRP